MANINKKDIEKVLKDFISTVRGKGVSIDKASELVEELITLVPQKRHDEWEALVHHAIEEANNKEGILL
ncbi:hypothetical protein D0U04_29370 [Bacillus clarus]|uniref:Uncharacterized protein n=1 Tax=Bacillus clarus TaxID=2338372 RepID=A0A090Z558_9BACI|nr:hypothetical protein [Bacillus clarus]KFN06419.1 hypothetical protein DJ93_6090 [Bacillus clarus]RFT61950.1 hypothetical protein D0U04_29370 [Bacillus clarus]